MITSIIKSQLDNGTFDLWRFYTNRVRRLAPALFATIALTLLIGTLWLFSARVIKSGQGNHRGPAVRVQLLLLENNQLFRLECEFLFSYSYVVAGSRRAILFVLSDSFYSQCTRLMRKQFWGVIVVTLTASFLLNMPIYFVGRKPEATFYLLPTRAWELLIGAMTLYVSTRNPSCTTTCRIAIFCIGMAMILFAFLFLNENLSFPGYLALIPTIGAASIIFAGSDSQVFPARFLSKTGIVYIGKISYCLYLVHWPMTVFARSFLGPEYSIYWRLLLFAASIGLASATYHLVETPIKRARYNLTQPKLMRAYLTGLLMSVGFCTIVYRTDGLPGRFSAQVAALAAFVDDKPPPLSECEANYRPLGSIAEMCQIGSEVQPDWLIYGDSHAWAGYGAFDLWLKRTGQSAVFIFQHSCPPLRGIHLYHDSDRCFDFNEQVFGLLAKTPSIKKVLLVSIWLEAADGISRSKDTIPTVQTSSALFKQAFPQTVDDLRMINKAVFIWEPVPGARSDVPTAMARSAIMHSDPALEFSLEEYLQKFAFFFEAPSTRRVAKLRDDSHRRKFYAKQDLACRFTRWPTALF